MSEFLAFGDGDAPLVMFFPDRVAPTKLTAELVERYLYGPHAVRRFREAEAAGEATAAQVQARVDFYGGLCWICGAAATTVDHVKPISRGGSKWAANLRPACKSCNSRKGATWPYRRPA